MTIEAFGEDGYLDYWQQLATNDVLVVDGWEQAYYSHFTAASDGDRPIVVSYATSPVAEVYFAEETPVTAPIWPRVLTDGTCFPADRIHWYPEGTRTRNKPVCVG